MPRDVSSREKVVHPGMNTWLRPTDSKQHFLEWR
jgi:hypothetical protein